MGFSRTNTTMDGWKCDKCNRVFLNAEDAEDCCVELGEPDKIVLPKCYNCQLLESRVRELESERDRLKEDLDDMFGVGKVCLECDRRAKYIGEVLEERDRQKRYILQLEENEREACKYIKTLNASHAALVEAANKIASDDDHHHGMCTGWHRSRAGDVWMEESVCNCVIKELKTALAEVKPCQKQR